MLVIRFFLQLSLSCLHVSKTSSKALCHCLRWVVSNLAYIILKSWVIVSFQLEYLNSFFMKASERKICRCDENMSKSVCKVGQSILHHFRAATYLLLSCFNTGTLISLKKSWNTLISVGNILTFSLRSTLTFPFILRKLGFNYRKRWRLLTVTNQILFLVKYGMILHLLGYKNPLNEKTSQRKNRSYITVDITSF